MGQGLPLLQQRDGAPGLHTLMVWFVGLLQLLPSAEATQSLGVRGGRPWQFLEMVGESQWKHFTRYITGLNHLRDLSDLLDHRLRACAWCQVKPQSSKC